MSKLVALPAFLLSAALAGGAGPAPAPQYFEVWEGTFTCSGTPLGARLSISDWTGTTFKLLGEMYPTAAATSAPRGRAELWGNVSGDLSGGRINLTGWRWLQQPQGYDLAKVGAQYQLANDYRSLKLTFDANAYGCTAAEFKRMK